MNSSPCPSCNQPVPASTEFCPNCGQYLGVVEETLKTPLPPDQEPGIPKTEPASTPGETPIPGTVPAGEMPEAAIIPPTVASGGPPTDTQRVEDGQFVCPFCGKLHRFGSNFCPITGEPLGPETTPAPPPTAVTPPPPPPSTMQSCPHCGNPVQATATFCPFCGNFLPYPQQQAQKEDRNNNLIWWVVVAVLLLIGCSGITALAYYCFRQGEQPLACIEGIFSGINSSSKETSTQTPGGILPTISASETPTEVIISASSTSTDTPLPLPSATETFTPSPTLTPTGVSGMMQYDLAFSSNRDGPYQIYVVDLDNPQEWIPLHQPQNANRAWHPTFCGDRVAAEIHFSNGLTPWIHLLGIEEDTPLGGNAVPERSRELGTPDCAYDSGYLAYSWKAARWVVKVIDLNSESQVREYTPGENHYYLHPFLPDSFRIYFVDQNLGTGQFKINEASLNSTSSRVISPALVDGRAIEKALYPATNKNMTQIAFYCQLSGLNQYALCLTNMGSTEANILVQDVSPRRVEPDPGNPAWSEDGQYIYFAYYRSGQYDIYKVNISTGFLENLTNSPGSNELMPAIRWVP